MHISIHIYKQRDILLIAENNTDNKEVCKFKLTRPFVISYNLIECCSSEDTALDTCLIFAESLPNSYMTLKAVYKVMDS